MSQDIKATVEELERLSHRAEPPSWSDRCPKFPPDPAFLDYMPPIDREFVVKLRNALPSLLAELRRLWAIEAAAVALREAHEEASKRSLYSDVNLMNRDRQHEARGCLFSMLPPRKPSGGEEAKP